MSEQGLLMYLGGDDGSRASDATSADSGCPYAPGRESQCVISPTLEGNLTMLIRTDDMCIAALTYWLKSTMDMADKHIRKILGPVRDPQLNNKQAAFKARKYVPELEDNKQLVCKYAITEFVMNTIDPVTGERPQLSSQPPKLRHQSGGGSRKRSGMSLTRDKLNQWRGRVESKQFSKTEFGGRRATGSTTKIASKHTWHAPTKKRSKRGVALMDTDKVVLKMGALKIDASKKDLESIELEPRRAGSVATHALKLKAESKEVQDGILLLMKLGEIEMNEIEEADQKYENTFMEEASARARHRSRESRKASNKQARIKRDDSDEEESSDTGCVKSSNKRSKSGTRSGSRTGSDGSDEDSYVSKSYSSGTSSSEYDDEGGVSRKHQSRKTERTGSGVSITSEVSRAGSSHKGLSRRDKDRDSTGQSSYTSSGMPGARDSTTSLGIEVGDDQRLESGGRAGITGLPGDEGKAQARLAGEDGIDKESETSSKGDGHAEDGTQDADQEEVKEPKYMTVDLTQPYADRPSPPIALNQGLEAQKYLITNKIPEMFEMLLTRLVMEQPTNPLDYLIELTRYMNKVRSIDLETEQLVFYRSSSDSGATQTHDHKNTTVSDIRSSWTTSGSSRESLPPVDG